MMGIIGRLLLWSANKRLLADRSQIFETQSLTAEKVTAAVEGRGGGGQEKSCKNRGEKGMAMVMREDNWFQETLLQSSQNLELDMMWVIGRQFWSAN